MLWLGIIRFIVTAIELHELDPVYGSAWITILVKELLGEPVNHFAFLYQEGIVMFFGSIPDRLDNISRDSDSR